ncbi:MAG: hypothetical protein QM698_11580 [Micropepsaceae bacterium]
MEIEIVKDYIPLISHATWKQITELHHRARAELKDLDIGEPFFPLADAPTGKAGELLVTFCGIAPGYAKGTTKTYDAAVQGLSRYAEDRFGLNEDGSTKTGYGMFWHEIAEVRGRLLEAKPRPEIRIGWANVLPIKDNPDASHAPQHRKLIGMQASVSDAIWRDLLLQRKSDIVVATFHPRWFDLDNWPDDRRQWQKRVNGKLWLKVRTPDLPHVVWVNHKRGRLHDGEPKAADIVKAITDYRADILCHR